MPSGRGLVVVLAGLALWLAARVVGSPVMHMVAAGLVALPFAAVLFARWGRQRLEAERRLSDVRVQPWHRVRVDLEVRNRAPASTSFLLLEDRLPAALGRPARLVLAGVPARGTQRATYTIVPHLRGRHRIGPLTVDVSDPFALTRLRLEFDLLDELTVTPEVEDLALADGAVSGFGTGASRAKHLFRTGEEFYTMRPYVEGDDLRRIHWPSVARTGALMIRQDESSRRSTALILLDDRAAALGEIHRPGFEKAVSVAASIGMHLSRLGYGLRLATSQAPPRPVSDDAFLETLAVISHSPARSLAPALARVRGAAAGDTTLVVVSAPPLPGELTSLIRSGAGFGPKLAALVHPVEPATLPPERQAQVEGR
ncbi:MAG TPA: DUF58 domain-containing protein, partial [Actinomycetota bacterium]|nr:DUF58 domain-containing protein [Actinomycetota bacterium]